jgi:hypothetical protein
MLNNTVKYTIDIPPGDAILVDAQISAKNHQQTELENTISKKRINAYVKNINSKKFYKKYGYFIIVAGVCAGFFIPWLMIKLLSFFKKRNSLWLSATFKR